MKTETIAVERAAVRRRFKIDLKDYGVLIGLLCEYFSPSQSDTFLSSQNLCGLLDQAAVIGLIRDRGDAVYYERCL